MRCQHTSSTITVNVLMWAHFRAFNCTNGYKIAHMMLRDTTGELYNRIAFKKPHKMWQDFTILHSRFKWIEESTGSKTARFVVYSGNVKLISEDVFRYQV